ncbi:MAG: nuclear transport factor 2 family protein [Clostridia bacterium]|nr:nuclear transport factor 2 family protein [Clostridia bacterium]
MNKTILTLEKKFFELRYIADREWLDTILHDRFRECGKSGQVFDKAETMESLLSCQTNRDITIYNFECESIQESVWLVHYITKDGHKKYYRTSVWYRETGNQMKLLFHQATLLNMDIYLKEC